MQNTLTCRDSLTHRSFSTRGLSCRRSSTNLADDDQTDVAKLKRGIGTWKQRFPSSPEYQSFCGVAAQIREAMGLQVCDKLSTDAIVDEKRLGGKLKAVVAVTDKWQYYGIMNGSVRFGPDPMFWVVCGGSRQVCCVLSACLQLMPSSSSGTVQRSRSWHGMTTV